MRFCTVLGAMLLLAAEPGPVPAPGDCPPADTQTVVVDGQVPAFPVGACCVPPAGEPGPEVPLPRHCPMWPEIWGYVGFNVYCSGSRMGPNGEPFDPLFSQDTDLNLGLLPGKKLYLFAMTNFWGQRAGADVTNPHQGAFDFSKREFDVTGGLAWNYYGAFELRAFGYALNNLNRGNSLVSPYGFDDGIGVENRYYFGPADIYDVGRLSFVSVGYLPSNALTGADGVQFKPGLFARAYVTWDLPWWHSYLYGDGQYFGEHGVRPRLLLLDTGLAVRPFAKLQGLEFRLGGADTYDIEVHQNRTLGYAAFRIQF